MMSHRGTLVFLVGIVVMRQTAEASGLGIPLDAWLVQFATFVTGLGAAVGAVGLLGWIGSLFDNPFSTILAGSINFFTKAGMLGGGLIILPALGLVGGATL
jgi:hypothetical protein